MYREEVAETQSEQPIRAFDDPEGLINVFRSEELKKAEWKREGLKKQLDIQKKVVKKITERDNLAAPGSEWGQGFTEKSIKGMIAMIEEEIK